MFEEAAYALFEVLALVTAFDEVVVCRMTLGVEGFEARESDLEGLDGQRSEIGDSTSDGVDSFVKGCAWHDFRDESCLVCLFGVEKLGGHEYGSCTAGTESTLQTCEVADGDRIPEGPGNGCPEPAVGRADAKVAAGGYEQAGSCCYSVDGRQDGDPHAFEAGEYPFHSIFVVSSSVLFHKLLEFADVGSRREAVARPADDHDADGGVAVNFLARLVQRVVSRKRDRVLSFWARKHDLEDGLASMRDYVAHDDLRWALGGWGHEGRSEGPLSSGRPPLTVSGVADSLYGTPSVAVVVESSSSISTWSSRAFV